MRVAVGYALQGDRGVGADRRAVRCTIIGDNKLYQRQIEASDEEIDALVYELYGLSGGGESATRPYTPSDRPPLSGVDT